MWTVVLIVALTAGLVAIWLWAHWPRRRTFVPDHPPGDETEHDIQRVGNLDRERVPGEGGVSGGGFGGFGGT